MLHMIMLLALMVPQVRSEDMKRAEAILASKPEDPEANLTLARWNVAQDDWTKALPFFAKAKDDALRLAAEREIKGGETGYDAVEIADIWVKASEKSPVLRILLREHALFQYGRGWDALNDPFTRNRLREKISALTVIVGGQAKNTRVVGWHANADLKMDMILDTSRSHSGRASAKIIAKPIEYLVLANDPLPAVAGKTYEASGWVLQDEGAAAVNLIVKFTNAAGDQILADAAATPPDRPVWTKTQKTLVCPVGASKIQVQVWGSKGAAVWVDDISLKCDGKDLLQNGGFEK